MGQRLAFVRLQGADEVPADGARQERGFGDELLLVVFAKVQVRGGRAVEGEDVRGRFQFRDGDEADLWFVFEGSVRSDWVGGGGVGGVRTFFPAVLADWIRSWTWLRFWMSCLARWGWICMVSSLSVGMVVGP